MKPASTVAMLLSFAAGAMSALCVSPRFRRDGADAHIPNAPAVERIRHASDDAAAMAGLQERLSALERRLADANAAESRETRDSASSGDGLPGQEAGETEEDRRRRLEAALEKIDFLAAIEVDGMGRQERRSHERLVKQLARREELTDLIESDISQEERDALILERKDADAAIRDLNQKVRRNLLSIVARNLGVEKEDAKEVVKTIAEIIKVTEEP